MTRCELAIRYVFFEHVKNTSYLYLDASELWTRKGRNTSKTDWDELKAMANDGWELVSVTPPTIAGGATTSILYTFKRPKVE